MAKKAVKPKRPANTRDFFERGKAVFIRTVTHYYVGRVVQASECEIILEDAAWVADTGRFAAALRAANFSEVEPYESQVLINRGAIVDATEWSGKLPAELK